MNRDVGSVSRINRLGFPRLLGVAEFQRLDPSRRIELVHEIRTRVGRWILLILPGSAGILAMIAAIALWIAGGVCTGWLLSDLRGTARQVADDLTWWIQIAIGLFSITYVPIWAGAWADHFLVRRALLRLANESRCTHCEYSLIGLPTAMDGAATCPECGWSNVVRQN